MVTNNKSSSVSKTFDLKQAVILTDLTGTMIQYLVRQDIVTPNIGTRRSRGTALKFTYSDLVLFRVIGKLLINGISVLRLKQSLKALRGRSANAKKLLTEKYVVTNGFDIFFQDKSVFERFESGQMVFGFVMELQTIRDEVDDRLLA